ncbi:hypothetical protein FHS43_000750 [Streptosporangium becharense]|uniref:Benzoate transporter n=1 Tax=Streptosporangium becharense TaxID=1816182 RepID=A0A7W9MGK9_9ACTN|nr:beta-propeller domain-containing protein [Streptosporangium becharense]MBB2909504.1 hypothetical protein [Streptosporangium becharense]MBB5819539.1 hypothetical protein [Streptosporangium becharense]
MRTSTRTAGAVMLAAALLATACTSTGTGTGTADAGRATPIDLTKARLVSYSGCDDMLAGLRAETAKNVGPWGIGGPIIFEARSSDPAAAKMADSAPEHSTTNVHEAGVDEPDLVKTDGNRVITVNRGVLRVTDTASRKVTGTLRLVDAEHVGAPADLLVSGDRALVLFSGGGIIPFGAVAKRAPSPGPRYVLVDLSGKPRVIGSLTPDGSHVDARMVGSTVRIVVRSQPQITFPDLGPDLPDNERTRRNAEVVAKTPIEAWLPKYELAAADGTTSNHTVECGKVSHPEKYTGTSMLTVHTLDLSKPLGGTSPIGVVADGDTVYGTASSLYVTSNPRWWMPRPVEPPVVQEAAPTVTASAAESPAVCASASGGASAEAGPEPCLPTAPPSGVTPTASAAPQEPPQETEVHRFDVTAAGEPRYVASGRVPGRVLNQYSLSEHDGHLRVATTSDAGDPGPGGSAPDSSSAVHVLDVGTLGVVGQVGGLGKGERIYSVRFAGPVGYVVTFKQVDPLYTLDLSDPAKPRTTGELKITGYSAYLHPAGDGRLIGVGQEASEKGRTLGTQVSLFDVGDPADPRRLSQMFHKDSGSEAEWDPHAFLYWAKTGTAVLPLSTWTGTEQTNGAALVLTIGDSAISKVGMINHPRPRPVNDTRFAAFDPGIRRSIVIGDSLWTVSDLGMKVNDLKTLADRAWIPFS